MNAGEADRPQLQVGMEILIALAVQHAWDQLNSRR